LNLGDSKLPTLLSAFIILFGVVFFILVDHKDKLGHDNQSALVLILVDINDNLVELSIVVSIHFCDFSSKLFAVHLFAQKYHIFFIPLFIEMLVIVFLNCWKVHHIVLFIRIYVFPSDLEILYLFQIPFQSIEFVAPDNDSFSFELVELLL